jgi:hypothetical protein
MNRLVPPKLLFSCVLFAIWVIATNSFAQEATLSEQIRIAIQNRDPNAYLALVSSDPQIQKAEKAFIDNVLLFPYTAVTMRVVDQGSDRILMHLFFENQEESRFEAWLIQTTEENGAFRIKSRSTQSSIVGLYRLKMKREAIPVSNFTFRQQDAAFHLNKGHLFIILAGQDAAGIVFLGEGSFEFTPADAIERQQVALFCKKNSLQTGMEHFYLRSSPENLKELLNPLLSTPGQFNQDLYSHALNIEKIYDPEAFGVKVPMSEETWYPRLEKREFFGEMKTPYGTLVYQYAPREAEDVLVSLKEKDQVISYYKSAGMRILGTQKEILKILSYDMRIACNPLSNYISGVANIRLLAQEPVSTISLKLNPSLRVSQVRSTQGPLLFYQQRETNKLQVILNDILDESQEISLDLYYQGRILPEEGKTEVAFFDQS